MALTMKWWPQIIIFILWAVLWLHFYSNFANKYSVAQFNDVNKTFLKELERETLPPYPGNSDDQLFWFSQISDIHVSKFASFGGVKHLQRFLHETLPFINPKFVVVTGDITDAKDKWQFSTQQQVDEWKLYQKTLSDSGLHLENFWFDLRGNHDCFDVPNPYLVSNHFNRYSQTKKMGFGHTFNFPFGNYSIFLLDACPKFGPARPLNFFGYLDKEDMDELESALENSKFSNHTIVLSHYPTATMVFETSSLGTSFSRLSTKFSLYLCGHLHRLIYGIGDELHAMQPTGFMELEVGDLKVNAMHRVVAIDHDLISFVDASLDKSPVILITNPKDARYLSPIHEPLGRIIMSTHIRVLIFSAEKIISANVSIDRTFHSFLRLAEESSYLWVTSWEPLSYSKGFHEICVEAVEAGGRVGQVCRIFSTDNTRKKMESTGKLIMELEFGSLVSLKISNYSPNFNVYGLKLKWSFWFSYAVTMIFLLAIPKMVCIYLEETHSFDNWSREYVAKLMRNDRRLPRIPRTIVWYLELNFYRLVMAAKDPIIFYPFFLYGMWIVVGPWFIGKLAPSSPILGSFYLYGLFADGEFFPLIDTWRHAVIPGMSFFMFIVYAISVHSCKLPEYSHVSKTKNSRIIGERLSKFFSFLWKLMFQILTFFFFIKQSLFTALIGWNYGLIAFLVSPGVTWFTLITICLFVRSLYATAPKLEKEERRKS